MSGFAIGHRVITKQKQPIYPDLPGYFGHVVEVDETNQIGKGPLVIVQFKGRAGGTVNPGYLREPWFCWADELEHAD